MSGKIGKFFQRCVDNYKKSTPVGKFVKATLFGGINAGIVAVGMNNTKKFAERVGEMPSEEQKGLVLGPVWGGEDWRNGVRSLFGFGHKKEEAEENGYEA